MTTLLRSLPIAMLIALAAVSGAHAQGRPQQDRVELPVWNRASGNVEAVLVLEPADFEASKLRARFGVRHLDNTLGFSTDSLGLLCDRKQGAIGGALTNLADNCVLASVPRVGGTATFPRQGVRVGVRGGHTQTTVPAWLAPQSVGNGRLDLNDLSISGFKSLPREGYVSIAGTVARARLQAPSEVPGFANRWSTRQLNLGGGIGSFGVNVIGQVVDTPGADEWKGLSVGLSWRTPWSGQLTVGADNVVTRGRNPFSGGTEDEGAVPYVRYDQDL